LLHCLSPDRRGIKDAANHKGTSNNDKKGDPEWSFVVSGDFANCGNVIMPAIARWRREKRRSFYWHLGDLRPSISLTKTISMSPSIAAVQWIEMLYLKDAWIDFIKNQLAIFGSTRSLSAWQPRNNAAKTRDQFIVSLQMA